jgi:subtilisin family serine protease
MTITRPRPRRGRIPAAAAFATLALVAVTGLGAAADRPAQASPAAGAAVPGELLVGFREGTGSRGRAEAVRDAGAAPASPPPAPGVARLRVDEGTSTAAAMAVLEDDPAVAWVQPNRYRLPTAAPNDPWFPELWGLQNRGQLVNGTVGLPGADADVVAAWDLVVGGADPLVAVVDTGIAVDHPDLAGAIATNPGESGGGRESNGVDDDGNGFVDDWRGWDFADHDNDAADTNGHGTLVAGTIAARVGNGAGVAGVSGGARVLPLRVVGQAGATDADIAAAFTYAARLGADVVNASLGGPGNSPVIDAAIAAAPHTLFVFPAGNAAKDNDVAPDYPCATDEPNAVCVAATDQNDLPAGFSSWGAKSVDLAAPGVNLLSTGLNDAGGPDYRLASGTSISAPYVAGATALMLRADATLTPTELRNALLLGAEPLPALAGTSVTGARLNVLRSLQIALDQSPQASPSGEPADPAIDPDEDDLGTRPLRSGDGTRRVGADRAAPRVTGLRFVRWTGRVTLRLRVSEGARVSATVARRGPQGLRTVRRVKPRALRAGVRSLGLARLAPGRYRVAVRSEDAAGNAATAGRWITLRPAA